MIKIHNIRLGFATNSSSSHSIVMVDSGDITSDDYGGDQEFGSDDFLLSSKKAKLEYLGQVLNESFRHFGIDDHSSAVLASDWTGTEIKEEGYVDHQSLISLPKDYEAFSDHKWISKEFFDKLKEKISGDKYVILGGSDGGFDRELDFTYKDIDWYKSVTDYGKNFVVKHDSVFDYYTLFNQYNGTKVRISFDDASITRASTPDLIDVKITNKCNSKCKYCYQNSNSSGKHANMEDIEGFIRMASDLKVFELAIGGGEPTLHPEFINILAEIKDRGIIPSFSTRNIKFLIENSDKIIDYVGSVGISVNNSNEVKEILKNKEFSKLYYHDIGGGKIMFHHVLGLTDLKDLCKMFGLIKKIAAFNLWKGSSGYSLPLLLLGYKNVGRGTKFSPLNLDLVSLLKTVRKKLYFRRLGLDTLLVEQNKDRLKEISEPLFWTSDEGVFSYYFDLVDKKMASCSYDSPDKTFKMNLNTDWFKDFYSLTPEERIIREIIE